MAKVKKVPFSRTFGKTTTMPIMFWHSAIRPVVDSEDKKY
jgi:hypothetical protein